MNDPDSSLNKPGVAVPAPGVPWWQTAKDVGAWTDREVGDVGYVHFGSTEALRIFVVKISRQVEAAVRANWVAPTAEHLAALNAHAESAIKAALGEKPPADWMDGGDDTTPKPIEGEKWPQQGEPR